MTIADLAKQAAQFATRNSPTILTSIGVIGTVTTAYLAGKASFEASDIIRLKEADDDERGVLAGTPRQVLEDRFKLVWKLYIPAATMGAATVACIIGANQVGSRRYAGLAAATSIIEKTVEEYKNKVVEKIGEKKNEVIHDEIAQERVNKTLLEDIELIGAGVGELCYDIFSDRYFRSEVETLRSAMNDFNHSLLQDGHMTLAEFYRILDITAPPFSETIGWNADNLMDLRITTVMAPGGVPAVCMGFRNEPSPNYGRFH